MRNGSRGLSGAGAQKLLWAVPSLYLAGRMAPVAYHTARTPRRFAQAHAYLSALTPGRCSMEIKPIKTDALWLA